MGKTAVEILRTYDGFQGSFTSFQQKSVEYCRQVLKRGLTDHEFQRELCAEYQLVKGGYPLRSPYPKWARQLAFVLLNPDGKISSEVREMVYHLCTRLYEEAKEGRQERFYTDFILVNSKDDLLKEIARDLADSRKTEIVYSC